MREDDQIKVYWGQNSPRGVVQLLGIDRVNLDEILRNCNYPTPLFNKPTIYRL